MKTRRALQIIVGILSLIVVLALLVTTSTLTLMLFTKDLSKEGNVIATTIYDGMKLSASTLGLEEGLTFLIPVLFYGLPFVLLLLASILLFLKKTDKQAKYVAGSVLALVGAFICSVFTIVFAPELATGMPVEKFGFADFSWTSNETIVRYASCGLLALFVIFVGSALGVKPKKDAAETADDVATTATDEAVTEDTTTEVKDTEPVQDTAVSETIEETPEQQIVVEPSETPITTTEQITQETPATEYVPNTDVTVNDVVQDTYGGSDEELSAEAVAKISKLRALLEANAITQAEYIKLVNIYLGKK